MHAANSLYVIFCFLWVFQWQFISFFVVVLNEAKEKHIPHFFRVLAFHRRMTNNNKKKEKQQQLEQ